MTFATGDKAVCINDSFEPWVLKLYTALPVKGRVYVVRDVKIGFLPVNKLNSREGGVRVLLVGLVNPSAEDGQEHGFNSERFRPLDEMKEGSVYRNAITNDFGKLEAGVAEKILEGIE